MTKGIRAARKETRPREILKAAFEEFATRGYAATSVEHIAARAGVTKGTIYVYFESKEDVFEKMMDELAQPHIDSSTYTDELGHSNAADILDSLLRDIYVIMLDDYYSREILRFLIAESRSFAKLRQKNKDAYALPILSAVAAIIGYGCESGEFRQDVADIDPLVLICPILGLNAISHVDPDLVGPSSRFIEQHLSMVRHFLLHQQTPCPGQKH